MAPHTLNRREFLQSAVAVVAVSRLRAQGSAAPDWGGPVLDMHLHLRPNADGNFNHIEGSGVAKAVLLTNVNAEDHARQVAAAYPGRFVRFASVDVTEPDAVVRLREAIRDGAIGLGEIKSHVEAAGPEMQRLYALAAELNVPITIHFQEISQSGSQGTYNTGLKKFDAMLKAFPKTKFIGHADAFWANVSADYAEDTAYPKGRIKPGGVTDRFLGDYPNLYADMSANSCNNFLNRDPEFAAGFLARHQDKLMFGSDCGCLDGRGTVAARQGRPGQPPPAGAPAPAPLAGKCIARETLGALKKLATPAVFRKIAWENGTRLLRI
ncbi:MAG TPA: amidohydrolase family protein [Vicinamibacterales bacterium]|jgi:predicted TIM-barrel fold metal-dependent hydrolase|nr:amidohydrolase family protein [Vicinamibacterales bacterium]